MPVSFSGPKKVLRVGLNNTGVTGQSQVNAIHIYGAKAAGQTPDDILFLYDSTNEFLSLLDWGNRPEGTLVKDSFRVKNASTDKIAKNINIQLNHADFVMSWDENGPWTTFVDIASLSPGAVSSQIYIKNELGPPLLTLGPKAARVIAAVGEWEDE